MTEGQRIALWGVSASAFLAALKITTGWISGSSALLADGFESTGDILASGLVWLGLTWAAKPADSNHPYGHGRAEIVGGLVVGLLLFCGGLAIAVASLLHVGSVSSVPATFALWPLLFAICVKAVLRRWKSQAGKRLRSTSLFADSLNDSVDILSGIVALAALALTLYDPTHFLQADRYGASVVGMIMTLTGIKIARRSGSELMDTMPSDRFLLRIRQVTSEVRGVAGVEKLFARKTGLQYHVDIHLEVDPEMPVRAAHELGHIVETRLLREVEGIADVLVHIEPARSLYDRNRYHFEMNEPSKIADATLNIPETKITKEPFGEVRMYFEGATDQLREFTAGSLVLHPGTSAHPPHRHPEEEILLVAEGSGQIQLEDDVKQVSSGAMMYCAGNRLHGIENTGSTPMLFYFWKWLGYRAEPSQR